MINEIISENTFDTVVATYESPFPREGEYETEELQEERLVEQLKKQGYTFCGFHDNDALKANLRAHLERLNDFKFTDDEWEDFFKESISGAGVALKDKIKVIQSDATQMFFREEEGEKKTYNIKLLDKDNLNNNALEVIRQFRNSSDSGKRKRYDVTILVNGLPLVQIELKKRGVRLRDAFEQINGYYEDGSYASGEGLFEYVQIFVISNGTNTKYYSATTKERSRLEARGANKNKTSNGFKFTSYWATTNNKVIADIRDFTATFFSRRTLLNIITKFCVYTSQGDLMVMRPYQISAAQEILRRVITSNNDKTVGTIEGGGFVWHTTGSGKTLTSFKTAQLAVKLNFIKKVLFVVDRKDLDYQTMREYDNFEKDCANSNSSIKQLARQLNDERCHIIVTTIQKLSAFIKRGEECAAKSEHVVIIFDECHRSQFGAMHKAIKGYFKNYHIFGFTGTPILGEIKGVTKATGDIFGDLLHTYSVVDAIRDENVLPFLVDFHKITAKKDGVAVESSALDGNSKRIESIAQYILDNFEKKTKRADERYRFKKLSNVERVASAKDPRHVKEDRRIMNVTGFNSILATQSVADAVQYYLKFKELQKDKSEGERLKIALIFSGSDRVISVEGGDKKTEGDEAGLLEEENPESTEGLDATTKAYLNSAIGDYNELFSTNYDISSEKFQNYYRDVSLRLKNMDLDMLIVVNMFLTGFDATTLNTLWVDKELRYHGLMQAFSRTNRILNSVKTYGNIVCFRNLEERVNDAIKMFGDPKNAHIIVLKPFLDYYNGYDKRNDDGVVTHKRGYTEVVDLLKTNFPLTDRITGKEKEKAFVDTFNEFLRLENILTAFDSFKGKEILSPQEIQDYRSRYIEIYEKVHHPGTETLIDPADHKDYSEWTFEIELIKQIEVDLDYIMHLIEVYKAGGEKDETFDERLEKAIKSSLTLRNKFDLIKSFVATLKTGDDPGECWVDYVKKCQERDLNEIINGEHLKRESVLPYMKNAFNEGRFLTYGEEFGAMLPPMSFFDKDTSKKRARIGELLNAHFQKYHDIVARDW